MHRHTSAASPFARLATRLSPARIVDPSHEHYAEFLTLFLADRDRLFGYIRAMLPNHCDAEDVFQRCSLLAWDKFDQYDRERPFFPWASGIAYYEVRNFVRLAARDRLQFDADLIETIATARSQQLQRETGRDEALQACLLGLRAKDRELIDAFYQQGYACDEIAKSIGRSIQTIFNRLSLLRRRLAECVDRRLADATTLADNNTQWGDTQ
ncbi:sigma-70 family RNA polymerase sigma factor [Stieleria sp. TO1_6]|uniref:sigma-70 family RNA polymerase sigma factor n=1 Tax=Stieleria tagensis TaxID=2956795 RepID=UPI00209A9FE7|nr:sigma-70 family RNA polymerase sigma factor [Stieleria tagensis]MCO8120850.1 sigma-70 family RNA polymerase sigma factor [Stieleria tagensis]